MTAHAEFIFERNIGLLHQMFHLMSCSLFLDVFPNTHVTQYAISSANTFYSFKQNIKVTSWVEAGGGAAGGRGVEGRICLAKSGS